jgi:putative addiction module component (TIGR02574 family)
MLRGKNTAHSGIAVVEVRVLVTLIPMETQQLLTAALSLPESERAELAASLIRSLDPEVDPDAEAAWASEIQRRVASIDDGTARLIPWDDRIETP